MERLIVVVDMIKGFLDKGALANPASKCVIPVIREYISSSDAQCIFLADRHEASSVELSYYPAHCVDSEEREIADELSDLCTHKVFKNSTNGFFALSQEVRLSSYEEITLVGVCTDICVLQLALTLKGYFAENNLPTAVRVAVNAVSTFDSPEHPKQELEQAAFKLMSSAGIQLVTI